MTCLSCGLIVVRVTSDLLHTTDCFHVLLLQVKKDDLDFGWGVIVNFSKKSNVKVGSVHFPVVTLDGQKCVDCHSDVLVEHPIQEIIPPLLL